MSSHARTYVYYVPPLCDYVLKQTATKNLKFPAIPKKWCEIKEKPIKMVRNQPFLCLLYQQAFLLDEHIR